MLFDTIVLYDSITLLGLDLLGLLVYVLLFLWLGLVLGGLLCVWVGGFGGLGLYWFGLLVVLFFVGFVVISCWFFCFWLLRGGGCWFVWLCGFGSFVMGG